MKSNFGSIIVFGLSSFFIFGCGDTDHPLPPKPVVTDNPISLIKVSDGFTLGGKPASSIHFGKDDENYCTITMQKNAIVENSTLSSVERNNSIIDGSCDWNGKHYVLSSKHPTNLSITFSSLQSDLVGLEISFKLVDIETLNTYLSFEDISLHIKANDMKKLS